MCLVPSGGGAPAPDLTVCVCPSQPLLLPVDTSCSGVCRHRSISPSSLLDTAISEEARPGPGLDEEQEVQEPPPGSTGRRHTLAEVSTCFSPGAPPCKCPWRPRAHLTGGLGGGAASSDDSALDLPFLEHPRPYGPYLDLKGSSRASGLEGNLAVLRGWQDSSLAQASLCPGSKLHCQLWSPRCWLAGLPGLWSPLPVADVLSSELRVRVVGDTAVCPIRGPGWQEMLQSAEPRVLRLTVTR